MKKIYITGITGLLGVNLAYKLKNKYQIIGADLVSMNMPDVTIETFDLLDTKNLEDNISKHKVDFLIHTAAAVNVDMCEENAEFAEKINSSLTKTITEICLKNKIKMIYISTDAVFDGKSERLYAEEDVVKPINVYSKTKYYGERCVLGNPDNIVIRTNIYGYNVQEKSSFGEWVLFSLLNNETIHMFEDIYFSPILVNDVADIIDKMIDKDLAGLYHVCATGSISKYEFAMALKSVFEIKQGNIIKSKSDDYSFKALRSKNMGMSNEKIKRILNIKIRTPIESIEYFKKLYAEGYNRGLKELGDNKDGY
jgi:dTDP-4-dehydrorhamnose reductase